MVPRSAALPSSGDAEEMVGGISLPDVSDDGRPFVFRASKDEILVVYIGFTSCPDICPTTLADLKATLAVMGQEATKVDPERDTAETLVDYVQWFIPAAHALSTQDRSALEEAGDAFGAQFTVMETSDVDVEVLHTAYLYGVDDTGHLAVT